METNEKRKYIIDDEQLMSQWDWNKNNELGIDPSKISINASHTKVWLICDKGHEYQAIPYHKSRGINCPFCSGRYAITGENDLYTLRPDLMEEWDWDKNNAIGIDPHKLKITSNVKVWWKCNEHNHSYCTWLSSRTHMKSGCPYCSGNKVLSGFNDLETLHPDLMKEWNYNKNINIHPNELSRYCHKKVWWICDKGHEWEAEITNRTFNGSGCPYCSNNKILEGFNDLTTTHPHILKEWDYDKNTLLPTQISSGSHKKAWWICANGHSWYATIKNRVNGAGCPECNKINHSSFPEQTIYYYIKKHFNDAKWTYKDTALKRMEIDVYIPSKNIGIEYDGEKWHKDINRDLKKDKLCLDANIHLIRVREPQCPVYQSTCKFITLDDLSITSLELIISNLLNILGVKDTNINIDKDDSEINNLITHLQVENSLQQKFPEIAKEWNFDMNGNLLPEHISYASHKKVYWHCSQCENDYKMAVKNRTLDNSKCPVCANKLRGKKRKQFIDKTK